MLCNIESLEVDARASSDRAVAVLDQRVCLMKTLQHSIFLFLWNFGEMTVDDISDVDDMDVALRCFSPKSA